MSNPFGDDTWFETRALYQGQQVSYIRRSTNTERSFRRVLGGNPGPPTMSSSTKYKIHELLFVAMLGEMPSLDTK